MGVAFVGMDREAEYLEIAAARIAHAERQAERARPLLAGRPRQPTRPLQAAFEF